jgi:hypothetical protein
MITFSSIISALKRLINVLSSSPSLVEFSSVNKDEHEGVELWKPTGLSFGHNLLVALLRTL